MGPWREEKKQRQGCQGSNVQSQLQVAVEGQDDRTFGPIALHRWSLSRPLSLARAGRVTPELTRRTDRRRRGPRLELRPQAETRPDAGEEQWVRPTSQPLLEAELERAVAEPLGRRLAAHRGCRAVREDPLERHLVVRPPTSAEREPQVPLELRDCTRVDLLRADTAVRPHPPARAAPRGDRPPLDDGEPDRGEVAVPRVGVVGHDARERPELEPW